MKQLIIFIFLVYGFVLNSQVVINFSTPGLQSWTCPTNVSQITVHCWGAGGGGGNSSNSTSYGGSGGGGGAFASKTINVTPGNIYYLIVGNGGTGALANSTALAQNGSDSWFNFVNAVPTNDSYILAKGGTRGNNNSSANPNNGGASSFCFGDIKVSGNSGNSGSTIGGGNGGSAANNGGNGGLGSTSTNGSNGSPPGGGGGGANDSPSHKGGNGADGLVIVSYYLNCSGTPLVPVVSNSGLLGCGNITLWATGYANIPGLQFQWQFATSSNGPWSDVLNATDTILNYTCSSDTYFKLKVTCSFSSSTSISSTVFYDYFETPVITTQPNSNAYCENSTQVIPLTVNATLSSIGSLNYQWYSNSINSTSGGTLIPGANSSSFIPSVSSVGIIYYYCVVDNISSNCNVISNVSTINVNSVPTFSSQPTSQTVCTGGIINNLSISYSGGNGIPVFQWYSNLSASNSGGSLIAGANTPNYILPSNLSATPNTSYYYCKVDFLNCIGCSTIYSNVATITIISDPVFSLQPIASQAICNGGSLNVPLTVTINGGSGTPTYQWYNVNGTTYSPIANTNSPSYNPPTYSTNGTYNYAVLVTQSVSGCVSTYSTNAEVVVVADPVISSQPISAAYCVNASSVAALSVSASGGNGGSYSYQWYNGTIAISGATSSTFTPPVSATGSTNYNCIVSIVPISTGCSVNSGNVTIVVNSAPTISTQPTSQTVCIGGTLNNLTVAYTGGSGTPTYQWFSNSINGYSGGSLIVGANSASYLPPAPTIIGTTYYYCTINFATGGCNQVASNIASISVNSPTVAGVLTSNQTICQSTIPTLMSVTGSNGNGFIWQYSLNNSLWNNISNSSNDTLFPGQMTLAGLNFTQNYYFRVNVIGNSGCNSQTTNSILITVIPPPVAGVITSPSTDQYVCFGSNSPSLILTGSSGTVQWESAPSNSGPWTSVIGGINATLSSTTIGILSQTTYFRAKVSNPICGSVYSSIRTIFIVPQAVLGNVSSNDTVCYGSSTTLTITGYTGTIQWQKYSNNSWVNIPGATSSQLNTGSLTISTIYRVIVSSGNCFSVTSIPIIITVNSFSTVGNIGSAHTICQGSIPYNIILNSFNGAITWQSSPNNSTWTDINGQSTSTLLGSAIGSLNANTYIRAKVTNFPCTSVYSNSILITVIPAGNPGTPSSNQTICSGTQPIPLVSTGTVGTLQWQFASNSNGPWTSIIGATSSTLSSTQMGSLTSTRYYRLAATNGQCTTIYSNNVTISVSQPSVSGTISSNQNICMGSQPLNISLSSFNGAIQWQESSNIIGPFSNIGNGSNPLTGSQVGSITSNKYIRAQVTSSGCPSTTSNILTITALTLPAISAGSDVSICNGDSLILNGSGGVSYQWSSNVVNGQPFIPQSTTTFTVVGIGSNGCSNTDNVVVTVLSLPNVTLNYSSPTQICQGGVYTITANTSSNVSFQWFRNNLLIAGATNNSIQVNQAGVYKVRVTSNSTGCQKYSNSINLTVLPVPTLNVVGNTNICSGDTAFLNAVSNGNVIWNGTLTQPSYQLSPTISTPFSVVSTGSNGCVSSYNDTIQVYYPFDTTINISSYGPLALNGYNYDQSGTYIQNLSSVYGCDSSVTINLYVYTNVIDESVIDEISIVNPVKNNIIQINKINDISFYLKSVLDCTGRKVKVQMLSSNQTIEEYFIDVIPGIYYLVYELNGIIFTKQLLFSN